MGHNGNSYYIGIDLNDSYAMVSFFQQNMKEPETVSTVAGSEEFQIPLVLARRKSIGKWYYGDEARRLSKSGEMVCIDQLLKRALNSEKIVIDDDSFMAEELLALFLKKVMELPSKLGNPSSFDRLVICVDRLTKENVSMFYGIICQFFLIQIGLPVIFINITLGLLGLFCHFFCQRRGKKYRYAAYKLKDQKHCQTKQCSRYQSCQIGSNF